MESDNTNETTTTTSDNIVVDVTKKEEEFKYTKIDCLTEDKPIERQKYVLLSFISPEGLMNCTTRGVKVRGVYASLDEAQVASDKLKKKDKYFHIYIGEVGKWLPWDPTDEQVETVKTGNSRLDKLMENVNKISPVSNLNEMVGRKQEQIDKKKIDFRNHVETSLKQNIDEYAEPTEIKQEPMSKTQNKKNKKQEKQEKQQMPRDLAARNRLQKLLEQKNKKKEEDEKDLERVVDETKVSNKQELTNKKELLNKDGMRLKEKKESLAELSKMEKDLANTIEEMKKFKKLNKK
jgi:hypothetical protein